MKQRDIVVIIVVAVVSGVASYFLANFLFGGEKKYTLKAPVVAPIASDLGSLDEKYFNKNSIDATITINIGDSVNPDPFKTK